MRVNQWIPAQLGRRIALALGLAVSVLLIGLVTAGSSPRAAAHPKDKLEATIFSYDGKDFVRTRTTLVTEDGKSAVNTKLDHASPAYKALTQKHSYVGEATAFGK